MSIAIAVASPGTIDSYTQLKAFVADALDRGDLTERIPSFIRLAEARLARLITHPHGEATATLTSIAGQETLALPTGLRQLRSAHLTTNPIVQLQQVSPSALREGWNSGSGAPQAFALVAGRMVLGPVPDAAYAIAIVYLAALTPLSPAAETNWLLAAHPDVYVYGALLQAEAWMANDERIPLWKAAFDEAIVEINEQGKRMRMSASPARVRNPMCV
jgi:hypothetical protein